MINYLRAFPHCWAEMGSSILSGQKTFLWDFLSHMQVPSWAFLQSHQSELQIPTDFAHLEFVLSVRIGGKHDINTNTAKENLNFLTDVKMMATPAIAGAWCCEWTQMGEHTKVNITEEEMCWGCAQALDKDVSQTL